MYGLIELIKILLFIEWLFIFLFAILLFVIRRASRDLFYRMIRFGKSTPVTEMKEEMLKISVKLQNMKIEFIISLAALGISLIGLWYLSLLPMEVYLLAVLGILIPLPVISLLVSSYVKTVLKKIAIFSE